MRTALLSFFTAMQTFAMGCEYEVVKESLGECPDYLNKLYQAWTTFIFVISPIFTFGFALSFFENLLSHIKYRTIYRNKHVYVFSEMNERSLTLAKDIKKNCEKTGKKIVLVFTDVFEKNEEANFELLEQVKKLGALTFKSDILLIDFNKHSSKKSISFFTIGNDTTENLNQTLELIEIYKRRENTNIYLFSTNIQSGILLSAIDKGKVKVRRINEVRSLINRTLFEKANLFFDGIPCEENKPKHISALIVGMGQYGTEMTKALSWFCQMDGYNFEINAFDKDPLAEEKFQKQAPELIPPEYKIKINSGYDIDTAKFEKAVSELKNTTYILVCLGDDDKNIEAAISLRICFERIGKKPIIQTIVYNTQQKKALQGIKNFKGTPYNIDFIGDLKTSYSEKVVINSTLEAEALKTHMKYSNSIEDDFWSFEYNYRSSIASAIHKRARILCNMPGADKKESDLTSEERETIEKLEHRRWNAYMRSEGYIYSGSNDPKTRNDLAKMHHNLTSFETLDEEDKRKDSRVATN
ncbi:MAG: hypothetical protein J6R60_01280 [Clostridia bacterium]|nr:hypothetical protein [Clostridia bacterium]